MPGRTILFLRHRSYARLAMKGSVQQSSVNRPEDSEHVPVIPGPGPGLMTGIRDSVPPTTPGKSGAMTTPGAPGFTGHIR